MHILCGVSHLLEGDLGVWGEVDCRSEPTPGAVGFQPSGRAGYGPPGRPKASRPRRLTFDWFRGDSVVAYAALSLSGGSQAV